MSGYFLWPDAEGNLERTDIPELPLTIEDAVFAEALDVIEGAIVDVSAEARG